MHPTPEAASPFSNFGTPRKRTVLIVLDDVSPIEVRHLSTGLRCSKRRLHFELVQANATTRSVLVLDANDEPFARVEGVRKPKHLCLIRIESGTIPGSKIRDENSLPWWIGSRYTSDSLPPLRVPIPHATPTMAVLIPMPRQHVHQHLQHVAVHPPLWLLRVELVQRPSASTRRNRWVRGRFRLGPRRPPPPTLRHGQQLRNRCARTTSVGLSWSGRWLISGWRRLCCRGDRRCLWLRRHRFPGIVEASGSSLLARFVCHFYRWMEAHLICFHCYGDRFKELPPLRGATSLGRSAPLGCGGIRCGPPRAVRREASRGPLPARPRRGPR